MLTDETISTYFKFIIKNALGEPIAFFFIFNFFYYLVLGWFRLVDFFELIEFHLQYSG